MASTVPFTLETVASDWPNGRHLYRIRVPSARANPTTTDPVIIKYLTGPCPQNPALAIPDYRGELLAFDTVPAGDWNLGYLTHNAQGKYLLTSTLAVDLSSALGLRSAGPTWHSTTFDLSTLLDAFYAQRALQLPVENTADPTTDYPPTDIQCTGYLSAAILPDPNHPEQSMVGIWAWEPGLEFGIATESYVYSLLQTRTAPGSLAPRFLGHLTDNGSRVVGFLLERVAGAREAGPADVEGCRAALARLHALGFAYGASLRKHSFLVCADGKVLMQRFDGTIETAEEEVLARDMERLAAVLEEESVAEKAVRLSRVAKAKV